MNYQSRLPLLIAYIILSSFVFLGNRSNHDWGYKFAAYSTEFVPSLFEELMAKKEIDGDESILVFESAHPYGDSEDKKFEINIPGATAIGIVFAEESSTEPNWDFLQFLKRPDQAEYFGLEKYSGGKDGSRKVFPGIGSTEALIIPASKAWARFVSDGCGKHLPATIFSI